MRFAGLKIMFLILSLLTHPAVSEIVITQPVDGELRIAQGEDYATYVIGDFWDMDALTDVNLAESSNLSDVGLNNGVLSFRTVPRPGNPARAEPNLWMLWPGLPIAFNGLERGEMYPIDTGRFHVLTIKVRMSDIDGQPLAETQPFIARFMEDANWTGPGALPRRIGVTSERRSRFNDWTIIQWDLADPDSMNQTTDFFWTDAPFIRGLRLNATNNSNVRVEIDWVRLTTGPANETSTTVSWSDSQGSGPYSVMISDGEFTQTLGSGISTNSIDVDLGHLPAGNYQIIVSDGTRSASSEIAINDVPLLHLTSPNIRGDQARDYGAVVTGNAWTSIERADIAATPDLISVRYDNPPGTLTARPTSSDPRILFNTPEPIDTAYYRMLCYTLEVKGQRDIQRGSVARLLWGDDQTSLDTSADIVVQEGLNEYCVGDLAEMRMDVSEPPGANWGWTGMVDFIRFDPHEFPVSSQCQTNPTPVACRDIRLDSFVLAPFHEAEGSFTITWQASDGDDDARISLYYDLDDQPFNGNEGVIVLDLAMSAAAGSFEWNTQAVPPGVYRVLAVIDDGLNRTVRYSTGPVRVLGVDTSKIFKDRFE